MRYFKRDSAGNKLLKITNYEAKVFTENFIEIIFVFQVNLITILEKFMLIEGFLVNLHLLHKNIHFHTNKP